MQILTAVLRQAHRDAGLYLEENEDFVYLRDGNTLPVATFHGRTTTVDDIWKEADTYVAKSIADNMEDYWKHQRCLAE